MSVWNVGACFTCTKCLLRSAWRRCPRCGAATVDLRVESLEGTWSAWRGFADGSSLASFRGVRAMKVIRGLALLFTIGACLAPIAGPWLKKGQPPELMEVVIALVMDALIAWPLFWFFSLYLLFIAHVFRGLSWVTSLGAEISPVGTLKFSVLARLTRAVSRALIPQLEVKSVASLDGASVRGVTTAPVTFHFVRDGWGFMERFDVHAPSPLPVKFDSGETQELVLTHGGVELGAVGTRHESSELPSWLEVPKRSGLRFRRELPAGTRFVLTRAREGVDDARVLLRLL